jgi:hypothetical protein
MMNVKRYGRKRQWLTVLTEHLIRGSEGNYETLSQDIVPAGKESNLRLLKYATDVVGVMLGISAVYLTEY